MWGILVFWQEYLSQFHAIVVVVIIILKIARLSLKKTSLITAPPAVIIVLVFCHLIVFFLLLLFRFCSRSPTCMHACRMSWRRTSCSTASPAVIIVLVFCRFVFIVVVSFLFKITNMYNQDELEEDILLHSIASCHYCSCFCCRLSVLFLLLLFRFCSRSLTCITRMSWRRTSCSTASPAISSSWSLFFSPPLSYRFAQVLIRIRTKKEN